MISILVPLQSAEDTAAGDCALDATGEDAGLGSYSGVNLGDDRTD